MIGRRIQTITTRKLDTTNELWSESNFGTIPGIGEMRIWTNVYKFIGPGNTAKFARRPFAGATRVEFKPCNIFRDTPLFLGSVQESNEKSDLYLCVREARKILGLGKNTKKFSLWYKRAA